MCGMTASQRYVSRSCVHPTIVCEHGRVALDHRVRVVPSFYLSFFLMIDRYWPEPAGIFVRVGDDVRQMTLRPFAMRLRLEIYLLLQADKKYRPGALSQASAHSLSPPPVIGRENPEEKAI